MKLNHLAIAGIPKYNCLNIADNSLDEYYKLLINFGALCNKAVMQEKEYKGSATESGILKFAESLISIEELREKNPIVNEIPFNSRNKFHLTIHKLNKISVIPAACQSIFDASTDKELLCIIKGAPEVIMELCSYGLNKDKIEEFDKTKELCSKLSVTLASNGERVIGLAFVFLNSKNPETVEENNLPKDLCFAGLLSLIDPPRPGVAEAVSSCHDGSIKVMMVTGKYR